ncbi:DUF3883 domain-containing protein [Flavitalea sp. BT771]|uniref:DUF3883 domain-containing protein n=1 Tax=Flavitalea sp. BT771 TaxID=3063329 RepID=UPI0026E1F8AB|nr:DUF3883 domain-containing protein [Flavitalea sp. BT771]MDO6433081.1 DUF3883 domain-containing protein [Flavitalea sp. BT771]MDV6221643.1 DUF3883 domain-containing protein [Flavitalea sp. BT771]
MSRKLAIKRLTSSDLTIFKWHHKTLHEAGNQKAINLNANIFIDKLYPGLPYSAIGRQGRIPLDLFIYGPGTNILLNLQRKIIKNETYKNWRLNGEFIDNPEDNPDRFNLLKPEDIVVFEFNGNDVPVSARAIFISDSLADDKAIFDRLNARLPPSGSRAAMVTITSQEMDEIIAQANPLPDHPIRRLSVDVDLEEAVITGDVDPQKIARNPSLRTITKEDFEKAKRNAEDNGQRGEELINDFLKMLQATGVITSFEWTSNIHPVYPYDFKLEKDGVTALVDVKSTQGEFETPLFISINELKQMAQCRSYDLYRVYALEETRAKLRIARNMQPFAEGILDILSRLPEGIQSTVISVAPETLPFGGEQSIEIDLPED